MLAWWFEAQRWRQEPTAEGGPRTLLSVQSGEEQPSPWASDGGLLVPWLSRYELLN